MLFLLLILLVSRIAGTVVKAVAVEELTLDDFCSVFTLLDLLLVLLLEEERDTTTLSVLDLLVCFIGMIKSGFNRSRHGGKTNGINDSKHSTASSRY